ncbi:hypothetical protein H4R21_001383 [Coemansia helicoidea]|uniref:Uncharacterized protein n=1 Tax=Coemansia helicoidea TaxID=1286919 RepID=A0ACC1LCS0_9FUNG|nr:hypothetical protein H4R21_001383 [Coemansia helicoidea]
MKRLRFTYNADSRENGIAVRHRDGHPWELHLPSLERLHIKCEQAICPLLEYAVLPPYMESITLYMMSADYLDMASVVLPETKRLSLRVSSFFPGDPSAFPAINRILKNACGSEVLELKIEDEMLRVGPESITCTALTHLRVKAPTSVDAMLAIIRALPNLVELTLKDLDLSDIQVDVAITEADKGAAVEPLHSSLQSLNIDLSGSRRKQVSVRAVAVLKYMLLRIPTLARVYSAEIPKEPVLDFVGAYAPRYPRLSSVVLNLYGR